MPSLLDEFRPKIAIWGPSECADALKVVDEQIEMNLSCLKDGVPGTTPEQLNADIADLRAVRKALVAKMG
jgi:hypothetical protein